jgi:ABC-type polysaccharide/polyol phosphate export permease
MFKASRVQRVFFFNMAVLILFGLWLTGFDKVHWFTYVIPAGLLFASATGLCLGLVISKKILDLLGIPDQPEQHSSPTT